MQVSQIATILNSSIAPAYMGGEIVAEDLSNIVTIGKVLDINLVAGGSLDNAVRKVLDKIGKTINWNKPYIGMAPNILRDSWEYGSILEKNRANLASYSENPTWNLQNGTNYLDGTYYMPDVSSKLFNKRTTFEVNQSFAERQFREAVLSASGIISFFGMIESRVGDTLTVALDALTMRTINNIILEHCKNRLMLQYPISGAAKSSTSVIDLLAAYNTTFSASLTVNNAMYNPDFIRYCAYVIALYRSRMRGIGKLFNLDGYDTHSPYDDQRLIVLAEFAKATEVFLMSDTYHDEMVRLGDYQEVPYWQSPKSSTALFTPATDSQLIGLPASGTFQLKSGSTTVTATGVNANVLAVLFDKDAAAITCEDSRVTSQYVPKGEFYTNFYKRDAQYLNDLAENCIVFTLGAPTHTTA